MEELKNRARGAISSRNFPVAVQLYSKAIEVLPETDAAGLAILRSNRSMCYLSVGNASSALVDAEEAERLDASYVKVYYRKAAALKALSRFTDARSAILKGLDAKGDDKDMKTLLQKIEGDIAIQGNKATAPSVPAARTTITTGPAASSAKSSDTASTTTGTTSSSSATKSKTAGAASTGSDEVDEDEAALGNVRGYKKTADGRTTTFFNNELDETAKRLIGDIAPKKVDGAAAAATETASANGSSVWNSAGTYEERLLSPWANAELKSRIGALAAHIEASDVPAGAWAVYAAGSELQRLDICVTEVDSVTGDAQVSMIRGKKKHLCDYSVELKWSLSLKHTAGSVAETVAGKLSVLDISADKEYEFAAAEVTHYNGQATTLSALPKHAGLLVNAYIKKSGAGLQQLIHDALMKFCDDLKSK